jgi:hypothetical protein
MIEARDAHDSLANPQSFRDSTQGWQLRLYAITPPYCEPSAIPRFSRGQCEGRPSGELDQEDQGTKIGISRTLSTRAISALMASEMDRDRTYVDTL